MPLETLFPSSPLAFCHHRLCFHTSPSSPSISIRHLRRNHGAASQLLMSHGWPCPSPIPPEFSPLFILLQRTSPFSTNMSLFNSHMSNSCGCAAAKVIACARKTGIGMRSMKAGCGYSTCGNVGLRCIGVDGLVTAASSFFGSSAGVTGRWKGEEARHCGMMTSWIRKPIL